MAAAAACNMHLLLGAAEGRSEGLRRVDCFVCSVFGSLLVGLVRAKATAPGAIKKNITYNLIDRSWVAIVIDRGEIAIVTDRGWVAVGNDRGGLRT